MEVEKNDQKLFLRERESALLCFFVFIVSVQKKKTSASCVFRVFRGSESDEGWRENEREVEQK